MTRAVPAAVAALALLVAGCGDGAPPPRGFDADAPAGWEERTYEAEQARDAEYEVVYERPGGGGVPTAINVQRTHLDEDVDLQKEAERARSRVLDELGGRASPNRLVNLAGDVALRFDHQVGGTRSTRLIATHGEYLYVVTLQAKAEDMPAAIKGFDAFVRSWRWTT